MKKLRLTAAAVTVFILLLPLLPAAVALGEEPVRLGLNFPATGPYSDQGIDQYRAAVMAVEEINAMGGILGRPVELVYRDSYTNVDKSSVNVRELIEQRHCAMIFGGSSSEVAVTIGDICQQKGVPFFGTLTYSTETTGIRGHRFTFRECYDSWMACGVLADYLHDHFADKTYLYITADYSWGYTTEQSLRVLTGTEDLKKHPGLLTPLGTTDYGDQLRLAKELQPDVLVLVLFGRDMVNAVRQAATMGLKATMQIVVPNLTLGMAEGAGPRTMEGVIGAVPWCWNIPYAYNYPRGKEFVESFAVRYDRYPSSSAASAYTIVYEYKAAAERAGSLHGEEIVKTLEGHMYQLLKDQQTWREFDHQSVQTVYAVQCKPQAEVLKDPYQLDFFDVLTSRHGEDAAISLEAWEAARLEVGMPTMLEPLSQIVDK